MDDQRWSPFLEMFAVLGPDPGDWLFLGLLILILMVLGGAAMLVAYVLKRRRQEREDVAAYRRICKQKNLDPEERAILDRMLVVVSPKSRIKLFASKNTFDQAVARWAKTVGAAEKEEKAEILQSLRRKLNFHTAREGIQVASSRSIKVKQRLDVEMTERKPPIKFNPLVLQADDFGITIEVPEELEKKTFFRQGETVDVTFVRPGEGTYGFLSRILEIPSKRRLVLGHSEKLNVSQMRGYVRVDVRFPTKFKRIPAEVASDLDRVARVIGDDAVEPISGEVTNLSGDGALLRVPQDFAKNDCAHFRIQFDGKDKESRITFYCRVIGSSPHPSGKEFFLRTQFVDMADTIRERVVQYLFKYQNEKLKEQGA